MSTEKRKHIRIPLLSQKIEVSIDHKILEADLKDISMGGAFIKIDDLPEPKEEVPCRIELPGDLGTLVLIGRVVYRNWRQIDKGKRKADKGFAVEWVHMSKEKQKILDALCVYLRNKQIISVSKRIIEEFFGKPKEPLT